MSTCNWIRIDPESTGVRPAMQLRVVDFPQPEGPRSTVRLPSGISSDRERMARVPPKLLVRSWIWMPDMAYRTGSTMFISVMCLWRK